MKKAINIAIITLDSLRYDVAKKANTPVLSGIFSKYGVKWEKAYAQGTFTLPSHISMFQAGKLPENRNSKLPFLNRKILAPFSVSLPWERNRKALYNLPEGENLVKSFRKKGYDTIGIGGVAWFSNEMATSKFWGQQYFEKFYWDKKFLPKEKESFKNQLELIEDIFLNRKKERPYFFFLNIASTHSPFMYFGFSKNGQSRALEKIDLLFPVLFDNLPRPCHVFIMADHGECFGEDGLWGHGFYHPKVMEIPFAEFILSQTLKTH